MCCHVVLSCTVSARCAGGRTERALQLCLSLFVVLTLVLSVCVCVNSEGMDTQVRNVNGDRAVKWNEV
jgi:hypothetical protein